MNKKKEFYTFSLPFRETLEQDIPHILTRADIDILKSEAKDHGRTFKIYIAMILKKQAQKTK